jgi:hypothetical protein
MHKGEVKSLEFNFLLKFSEGDWNLDINSGEFYSEILTERADRLFRGEFIWKVFIFII